MESLKITYFSGQTTIINSFGIMAEEDVFSSYFKSIGEKGLCNIKDAFITSSLFLNEPIILVKNGSVCSDVVAEMMSY